MNRRSFLALAVAAAFPVPSSAGRERTIFIENDAANINLRKLHDALYATPTDIFGIDAGGPGVTVVMAGGGGSA